MVGTREESKGIIKHGSKMIQAVTNCTVPKITLRIGASFGAGEYGMAGRSFDPRFMFSWPNNKLSVMGGEQAGKTMSQVATESAKRRGEEPNMEMIKAFIISMFGSSPLRLADSVATWDIVLPACSPPMTLSLLFGQENINLGSKDLPAIPYSPAPNDAPIRSVIFGTVQLVTA